MGGVGWGKNENNWFEFGNQNFFLKVVLCYIFVFVLTFLLLASKNITIPFIDEKGMLSE